MDNATILIISDEDLLRELLSQVLVTRGFRVATVAGIPEGLNSLKRKGFDLIIIDYVSLEKSKESMKEIKRRNGGKPVALLKEPGDELNLSKVKISGVDLVIGKPLEMGRSLKQINEILLMTPKLE